MNSYPHPQGTKKNYNGRTQRSCTSIFLNLQFLIQSNSLKTHLNPIKNTRLRTTRNLRNDMNHLNIIFLDIWGTYLETTTSFLAHPSFTCALDPGTNTHIYFRESCCRHRHIAWQSASTVYLGGPMGLNRYFERTSYILHPYKNV